MIFLVGERFPNGDPIARVRHFFENLFIGTTKTHSFGAVSGHAHFICIYNSVCRSIFDFGIKLILNI